MKKYLISAASCQEHNAILVSANSIDDVIAMIRRGDVDLNDVMDVSCQFRGFDIEMVVRLLFLTNVTSLTISRKTLLRKRLLPLRL